MIVTERDEALLYYLWQNQYMTLGQLHQRFWYGRVVSVPSERLKLLSEGGFISYGTNLFIRDITRDRKYVVIGRAGLAYLIDRGILPADRARDTPGQRAIPESRYAPTLYHDLQVVDLRIALERSLPGVKWTSDHELRLARKQTKRSVRVVDGAFTFGRAGGVVREAVLENERAEYGPKSFKAILALIHDRYPKAVVFFVCQEAGRIPVLIKHALDAGCYKGSSEQLLFGAFKDVRLKGSQAAWVPLPA